MILNFNIDKKVTGEELPSLSPALNEIKLLVSDLHDAKYAFGITIYDSLGAPVTGECISVNWGDGNIFLYEDTSVVEHEYSVGTGTPHTGNDYTFWEVTIKPKTAGHVMHTFIASVHTDKGVNTDYGYLGMTMNTPDLVGGAYFFNNAGVAAPELLYISTLAAMPNFTNGDFLMSGVNKITNIDLTDFTGLTSLYLAFNRTLITDFTAPANLSAVTTMSQALSENHELLTANLSSMTGLTNIDATFMFCEKLTTIIATGLINILVSTDMVTGCDALVTLDIRNGNFSTAMMDAIIDSLPVNATPGKTIYLHGNTGTSGVTHTKTGWTIDTTTAL